MSSLWLPDRARLEEQVDTMARAHWEAGRWLERELRGLDPHLRVVLAKEGAEHPDLEPGFWHVVRLNQGCPDHVWVLRNPEGGYREPGSWVIEELRKRDLWNRDVSEHVRSHYYRDKKRREKAITHEREQGRDEARATYRAAKRVAGDGGMEKRRWGRGIVGHA